MIHIILGAKRDGNKIALLARCSPSPRNEGRGAEAGTWEVVDDRVDKLLGE